MDKSKLFAEEGNFSIEAFLAHRIDGFNGTVVEYDPYDLPVVVEHAILEPSSEERKKSSSPMKKLLSIISKKPKEKEKEKSRGPIEPISPRGVEEVQPEVAGSPRSVAASEKATASVLWFEEIVADDIPLVGGKVASLGEMLKELKQTKIRIPTGFAVTATAYRKFIKMNGLHSKLEEILRDVDPNDIEGLRKRGKRARELILSSHIPATVKHEITECYEILCRRYSREGLDSETEVDVAVRSSATAEDLPTASFAGQLDSFLNISGTKSVLDAILRCYASLYTDRAISYRIKNKFEHSKVYLSVGIQKMVRSDLASAGVAFTIDTDTGFSKNVLINAAYGLGESVVQGRVNPDEYCVFKPLLQKGFRSILYKQIGTKSSKIVYTATGTKTLKITSKEKHSYCLTDDEILQLSHWCCDIESHYTNKSGKYCPMDIEWAKDGQDNQLYVVQARPETVQSQRDMNVMKTYRLKPYDESTKIQMKKIVSGMAIGSGIGQGKAHFIASSTKLSEFKDGEVLVTGMTDPDWEPIMRKAVAIVTNEGGRTCHAAIIARELGIPAIVGTKNATELIKNGTDITVTCIEGEFGAVYNGLLPFDTVETKLDTIPNLRTKIMLNIGEPSQAFSLSTLPVQGVGLARLEFIIANHIKIHPMALIYFSKVKDKSQKKKIEKLTRMYPADCKEDFFVDTLASGVSVICAAFWPKPVIVRLSDFKSNEYASLLGGSQFEPHEHNPMLGWRGASRYYHQDYRAGFALECRAMKKVKYDLGLDNLVLMVPFVRTLDEGRRVIQEMKNNGLELKSPQNATGMEVYMMCEVPSNVILASEFADIFDGFSIGSNDLTSLVLGIDRDSQLLQPLFDERNEAVKRLIRIVIQNAKARGCHIGICGEAPSNHPDFARFLVSEGISSISVNAQSVLSTIVSVAESEAGR